MNITELPEYEPGFFDVFFTSIGVFVTGVAASFVVIGIMIAQKQEEWDSDEELPFIQRFYEEFNELEEKDLTDDKKKDLKSIFLEIETDGSDKVIMCWDDNSNRFDYWCNNKLITYLELDACAQKYAIDNNCKCLVVNYKQEYDNAIEEWKRANKLDVCEGTKKDSNSDKKDDSSVPEENVFATFKNYNYKPINKHNDKPKIITKKSNHFRRAGSIMDYKNDFVKKNNEKSITDQVKTKLVYTEWKNSVQNVSQQNKKDK